MTRRPRLEPLDPEAVDESRTDDGAGAEVGAVPVYFRLRDAEKRCRDPKTFCIFSEAEWQSSQRERVRTEVQQRLDRRDGRCVQSAVPILRRPCETGGETQRLRRILRRPAVVNGQRLRALSKRSHRRSNVHRSYLSGTVHAFLVFLPGAVYGNSRRKPHALARG